MSQSGPVGAPASSMEAAFDSIASLLSKDLERRNQKLAQSSERRAPSHVVEGDAPNSAGDEPQFVDDGPLFVNNWVPDHSRNFIAAGVPEISVAKVYNSSTTQALATSFGYPAPASPPGVFAAGTPPGLPLPSGLMAPKPGAGHLKVPNDFSRQTSAGSTDTKTSLAQSLRNRRASMGSDVSTEAAAMTVSDACLLTPPSDDLDQKSEDSNPVEWSSMVPPTAADVPLDQNGEPTSIGSFRHAIGSCKACIFHNQGCCNKGAACTFCHFQHTSNNSLRLCKGKRERYKKLLGWISKLIEKDPMRFPANMVQLPSFLDLPNFIGSNDELKAKLLADVNEKIKEVQWLVRVADAGQIR